MNIPNYKENNIINLISSIKTYSWVKSYYSELKSLDSKKLNNYQNIVLFVVDALWYNWLQKYWKNSFLHRNLKQKLQTVFPSSTACVITTINTWFLPFETWVLWRNMYSKKLDKIIKLLPWEYKIPKRSLWNDIKVEDIVWKSSFYEESNKEVFIVTAEKIYNSKYNIFYNKNLKTFIYDDLDSCFLKTLEAIKYNDKQKYIFSYWDGFDKNCHDFWVDSKEAFNHFQEIDLSFEKLYKSLQNTNSLIIVTADHWQINLKKIINFKEEYRELNDMLKIPLAWAPRYQYCFVKEEFIDKFYTEVKKKLWKYCEIYTKEEVIKMKVFWEKNDSRFLWRIWDFLILPNPWVVITDWTDNPHIAYHWWLTDDEMNVPLIYF